MSKEWENNSAIKFSDEQYKILKKKKKSVIKRIFKAILILILIIILLIIIVGGYAGYKVYQVVKDVEINKEDLIIEHENSVVKDLEGNLITILNGDENRESIKISEMSEYLPIAFISIEDERFYEHKGVDIKRTLGAVYTYLRNHGESPFGGSTITQQMVKNITQETEGSWQRKAREMVKAYYAEQQMSKEEILELYLNLIFLGDTVYGVEQGANFYFNKSAKDLDLAESAFLAGINHSPNSYDPFNEKDTEVKERIKERTKIVLNKMYELGNIKTEKEYKKAIKNVEKGLKFERGAFAQTVFSYHTDAAINQIINQLKEENDWSYKKARQYLFGGGFTIYTTQNSTIQTQMDEEINNDKYKISTENQNSQAAMVLIDYKTGYVLAISGGIGEKTTAFGFNRATDAKRQTGSSMKPLAALAPSIDKGIITAATIFDDNVTSFANGTFTPKNYGNYYRGLISVRNAIGYSQNIPMVKVLSLLTPTESIKFLKNAGISTVDENQDANLSLALGGLTWGITPLEMAGAYGVIANDGVYVTPTFYTKVVDSKGYILMQANQKKRRVISKAASYVVKEILTEPVKTGTATICAMGDMSVAAKTGTTNNDYDRWLCGFTPYYVAATWYGYDNPAEVRYNGYNPAGLIWSGVMNRVHEGLETKTFNQTMPSKVVEVNICKKSGFLATSSCQYSGTTYNEYFVEGTQPIQTCPYHSSAKVCTESGLLANENCPRTRSVYGRGEYIDSKGLWETRGYWKIKNIPTEACTIH